MTNGKIEASNWLSPPVFLLSITLCGVKKIRLEIKSDLPFHCCWQGGWSGLSTGCRGSPVVYSSRSWVFFSVNFLLSINNAPTSIVHSCFIKAAHQTWSQKTLSKTRKILSMTPNPSFSIASTCNVTFAFANPFLLAEFTFWSGSVGWNKVLWEALRTPRETVQMATWLKKENHSLICFWKKWHLVYSVPFAVITLTSFSPHFIWTTSQFFFIVRRSYVWV